MSSAYEISQKKTPDDIARFIRSAVPFRTHNSLDVCEPSKSWLIMGFVPGGYRLHFVQNEHVGVRILVGCRNFTYDEAMKHWGGGGLNIERDRYHRARYLYNALPLMRSMLEANGWNFNWKPAPKTKIIQVWKLEYLYKINNGWRPGIELHMSEADLANSRSYADARTDEYKNTTVTGPHSYVVPVDD